MCVDRRGYREFVVRFIDDCSGEVVGEGGFEDRADARSVHLLLVEHRGRRGVECMVEQGSEFRRLMDSEGRKGEGGCKKEKGKGRAE